MAASSESVEYRKIGIPPHRLTPLKQSWMKVYTPLVERLGLQVKMNLKGRCVEIRSCFATADVGSVQKGADFLHAFALGFELDDCIALLRVDDLFVDSFEIRDVKTLNGDHQNRAVGRIVGKEGKTKYTIENTSKTRIVIADTRIHILGSFQNIRIAKDAVVNLILGSPPGKVYAHLKNVATRLKERS